MNVRLAIPLLIQEPVQVMDLKRGLERVQWGHGKDVSGVEPRADVNVPADADGLGEFR